LKISINLEVDSPRLSNMTVEKYFLISHFNQSWNANFHFRQEKSFSPGNIPCEPN